MNIRIIRSKKRRKTVQAREVEDTLEIMAPARMSDTELESYIDHFKARFEQRRKKTVLDDRTLEKRANELNRLYFDDRVRWVSIRWVTNQKKRWGSCSPENGTLRISHRLARMPQFVQDYVIVHELAHLLEPNHGNGFWELVYRFPRTERARGYLMAMGMEEGED